MKKTNCVNCGGLIDAETSTCPFCGTSFLEFDVNNMAIMKPFALRLSIPGREEPLFMNAYVSNVEFCNEVGSEIIRRDEHGRIHRKPASMKTILKMNVIAETEKSTL